ncbi:MAG: LamG domain-containing protein [Kiritimatiellae bacterium]|nr:LamG domain-containing protein [Kiritimatiellia bacterium]
MNINGILTRRYAWSVICAVVALSTILSGNTARAGTDLAYNFNTYTNDGTYGYYEEISGNGRTAKGNTQIDLGNIQSKTADPFNEADNLSVYFVINGTYIDAQNLGTLNLANTDTWTVEAWIVNMDYDRGYHQYAAVVQMAGDQEIRLGLSETSENNDGTNCVPDVSFTYGTGQIASATGDSSDLVNVGNWMHMAATYDGADLKLYVQGSCIATTALASIDVAVPDLVRIGRVDSPGDPYGAIQFYGYIDDFRISDKALSASELGYHAALVPPPPPPQGTLIIVQ